MNLRSGLPFALLKNGLPYNYPKLECNIKTDIMILGGGISGALVAYHLIESGVDCILIDGRTIGLGSTCASTSLLQYEIDTPLYKLKQLAGLKNAVRAYKLCAASIYKLGDIAQKISFHDFYFRKSLYYAAHKKDVSWLKEEFASRKEHEFDVLFMDENTIKKEFGFKAPAAILSSLGGQMDAYRFTHALLQHCIKKGMAVYDRTMVKKITHGENGIIAVTENGFKIRAKKIVHATGYEVEEYINKKICRLHSTFACISEQANEQTAWKDDVLIWNTADPYLYMRKSTDGRILIGGRDEKFNTPGQRDKLLPYKTKQLVNDFRKLFPAIDYKAEFSWAGTFGSTIDGLPYIGHYKKLPNSLFSLGFGGNGITFSLIGAEILRDIILRKKNSDGAIFSFTR